MTIIAYVKKYGDEIPVQCRDLDEAKAKRGQYLPGDVRIEVDGEPYVEEAAEPAAPAEEVIDAGGAAPPVVAPTTTAEPVADVVQPTVTGEPQG